MAIDLKSMSRKELSKLKSDIETALRDAEKRERSEARKAAEKAAAEFGFSLDDIASGAGKGRGKKASVPKYRNPKDASQTWSGRGRQPQWFKDAMAKGTDASKLEI